MSQTSKSKSTGAASAAEATSLIEEILSETRISPQDEAYAVARKGVETSIAQLLGPSREVGRIDKSLVDKMIAEVDERMSRQLDEILHHPEFQKLESAWRGLKFVIDRTDFRENVRI